MTTVASPRPGWPGWQTAPLTTAALDGTLDAVVAVDVRAFWTPPAQEWDVVARVPAPAGRVVVGFSVMRPGADDDVAAEVGRAAGARGLRVTAVHRGATAPIPSAAVELRRALTPTG
ncbi:hypothetical protein [Blastococcus sp. URHD0036]|uniref:hypothetical protein n=1 Tax=Blastococcus sp. URHD0036 TaxID=1380356 RepID=UPI000497F31C|nr:hypothetical protein [Blastococcus sp. URHD0036]